MNLMIMNIINAMTRRDFKEYLCDDILVKIDRTSMANSLELRAPFLDKNIIEFAFYKLPAALKVSLNKQKTFLKHISKEILPKDFNYSRKQGFSIPLNDWLRDPSLKDLIHSALNAENSIFERKSINEILNNQDNGYSNSVNVFALSMFQLWKENLKYIYSI